MKRQSVLVELVEEEEQLVLGSSGESHKKLKAEIQEERSCVCVRNKEGGCSQEF